MFPIGTRVVLDREDYKPGKAPEGVVVRYNAGWRCYEVTVTKDPRKKRMPKKEHHDWHETRVESLEIIESRLFKAMEEE